MVNWNVINASIGIIGVISSIIIGIWAIELQKENTGLKEQITFNNNNQQGGISAGKIDNLNLGSIPRQLTPEITSYLDAQLEKLSPKGVYILTYNDVEASSLSNKIKVYLESKGWDVSGTTILMPSPFYGLSFDLPEKFNRLSRPEGYALLAVGVNPSILG